MSDVKVFGVIGAGQMGRGIAQVAAQQGFEVPLLDASAELAAKGQERIGKDLSRLVEKGKLSGEERDRIVARVKPIGEYAALAECDFVVEAATEDLRLKSKIFENADAAMRPGAILASNTSSISLTKLAA